MNNSGLMYNSLSIQQIDNGCVMSKVIKYTENNFADFEWYDGFSVIRFYADWCAPCVQNFPIFEQLTIAFTKSHPHIKFGKINIDQSPILALRYNVYGLPSTLIFYQGRIIERIAGVKHLREMKDILCSLLNSPP